ncbi:hypothetical protein C0993_009020 [Termitomyces sp. T159_Od127]|nr:hypothetical protein C0993_009020 [Termitomyces sp. T159_Od127]
MQSCRSLSSTATPSLLEESRSKDTIPKEISGDTQNTSTDLEDGEIVDETNPEEAQAVDGLGEVFDRCEPSLNHRSRLDVEFSEKLGREHESTLVPKPSISAMEALESFGSSGEHSGIGSPSYPISTPASVLKPDVPVANSLFARGNHVSSLAIDSHLSPVSEEELELAKDVVLDLLGWGVQPEYLIECGISSHAIYRIFTDLHLRFPTNLSYFGPG